jgi:hypothetical protein
MKYRSNTAPSISQSAIAPSPLVEAKRKAERIRLIGWLNVLISAALVSVSPSVVPALIGACFWILVIFGVTQAAAWRLDKKAADQFRRTG